MLPIEWLNRIWRPDSYFKNAKQVTFQTMTIPNHYVWLYRTKKIFYMVKYVAQNIIAYLDIGHIKAKYDKASFVWFNLMENIRKVVIKIMFRKPNFPQLSKFVKRKFSIENLIKDALILQIELGT